MKVYLAAKYSRRFELRYVRNAMKTHGIEVTSRWIDNEDGESEKGSASEGSAENAALIDLEDIDKADAIIFFGEPAGTAVKGGGRWLELGYALAKGKKCIAVIDGHESVFTHHPNIVCVASADEATLQVL